MFDKTIYFDDFEVDFQRRELRQGGITVGLQEKPFRVLELLLRHPGELVSRQALIAFLWPDSHVGFAHGLNTAVNSLRQGLGESSRKAIYIETRPGLGYRFTAAERLCLGNKAKGTRLLNNSNQRSIQDCRKGRYFLDRYTAGDTHRAIPFFRSALASDATCAMAHAGIANASCQLAVLSQVDPSILAADARSAVSAALRLAPDLADARVASGNVSLVFNWDWPAALAAATRALTCDSFCVSAYILQALALQILGSAEESLTASKQALALDPLSFPANLQVAASLFASRDFEGAVTQCWSLLVLQPQLPPAHLLLALAYEQLGSHEESNAEFENAALCSGLEAAAAGGLAHLSAKTRSPGEAHRADLPDHLPGAHVAHDSYGRALLFMARGHGDQALSQLEEAHAQRSPALFWLASDPRFDPIRDSNRFQALMARLGIPAPSQTQKIMMITRLLPTP